MVMVMVMAMVMMMVMVRVLYVFTIHIGIAVRPHMKRGVNRFKIFGFHANALFDSTLFDGF